MDKMYRVVYVDRNGHQGTQTVSAPNAAAAKAKFLSGHPGYKILACGEQ